MQRIAIIGAGARGWSLARRVALYADRAEVSAVVEPAPEHREAFGAQYAIPPERCHETHNLLLERSRDLGGAIITSPVSSHARIACDCLEAGVPTFLDKPMARDLPEARAIARTAERTGTRLQLGFNCRYAPFFAALKRIVADGKLGRTLAIEWKETITPSHWAEYCRHPSYNRRDELGSWLLEKCCHDIDLLSWIVDSPCVRVASFGSRSHFNPRADVPEQCTPECPIERECVFSAAKLYGDIEPDSTGRRRAMPHVCVYHSGADLVDHQSAILEYDNGVTAAFSLLPLSPEDSRFVRICGSDATLRGRASLNEIRLQRHDEAEEIVCDPPPAAGGHGGADPLIILAFLDWLDDPSRRPATLAAEGLDAMVICCGIDLALREKRVVELDELRSE